MINCNINSIEQKLKDFETLEKLVNGDVGVELLEEDLKSRLINLCEERLEAVERKIAKKTSEADALEKYLKKLDLILENY